MLSLDRQNRYREEYKRRRPGWRPSGEVFEALVRQRFAPGMRVLDVGCGRGGVIELLWREAGLPVGVDPDLASLREHRAGVRRVCGLGEALPLAAGQFDLVLALWVLEHVARPDQLLAEVHRALRPGGRFLFLTPNARHPLLLFNRFSWAFPAVQRLLVPRLYGRAEADTFRVRYQANTQPRLRQLAASARFVVDDLTTISDPTYLAFNEPMFRLSTLLERLLPASLHVHLIGDWQKA
jgi:SAM-dependent methyltransferase